MSQPTCEPNEDPQGGQPHGRRRAEVPANEETAKQVVQDLSPARKGESVEAGSVVAETIDAGANQAEADAGAEESANPSKQPKKAKKPSGPLSWLKEIAIVIVIALVLSFLLKTFLFRAFVIPSESMQNTLQVEDRIFINELVPRPFALQRGDVVVFKDTQGWLAGDQSITQAKATNWFQDVLVFIGLMPDESQQHLVKRVIGMAGDHVICCDAQGRITVNGQPLDEPYLFPGSENAAGLNATFDVVVPAGKIWVMGDNRNNSADSRFHQNLASQGFIDLNDVEGTATVIAWPLNRWSFIGNYPDTFRNVPAPSSTPVSSPTPTHSGK
ncbi:signal peptidase I [Psychromicrobium lacuslunae]|uniref:Signal peptidase I n=1 Tax=Psychromicrobium lacuslunae TaxID=1618207 RepID=A0A0D4BYL0_9MICC|nr:signal peptidase I [Psychromicrobium lacuslunae]AJT41215.1 signal peptidase [Psychromicrobium lacuslunae]